MDFLDNLQQTQASLAYKWVNKKKIYFSLQGYHSSAYFQHYAKFGNPENQN